MLTLIEILLAVLFFISLGLFMLHKYEAAEIQDLRDELRQVKNELKRINSNQDALKIKLDNIKAQNNTIEIVHKYDDSDAPDYPNKRGA